MPRKKKKTAKPNLPNQGLEVEYRKKLYRLINQMHLEIQKSVKSIYKSRKSEITEDQSPSKELIDEIDNVMAKWVRIFDISSNPISEWFIRRSDANSKINIGKSIAKVTDMTVKFKTTKAVEDVIDGLIAENVSLIKSIPREYHTQVNTLVMDSVRVGRDLGGLTEALDKRYSITRRRAAMIARDQNNKATESIGRERNKSLGIVEGDWMHRSGSKQPRKPHVRAHGKRFRLDKGLKIEGEYIFPGQKINCNCSFRPVIPGFS